MKAGLDTSIILRLLTGEPERQAQLALTEVQALIGQGTVLLVSDLVVAEVYFALQHHYAVPTALHIGGSPFWSPADERADRTRRSHYALD